MFNAESLPKLSIIIPTYNRAGYLLHSIESIRKQTYKNWELIIVDDGSEDNTEELVNSLADDRIRFVKIKHSGIGGVVKNVGIHKSSGELLAFLDSDDLWAADKIEKQVMALQQNPGAGFCLTNGYNFKNINEPVEFFYKQKQGYRYDNIFISCFKSEVAGFTQALMVRRQCIHSIGLFKESKSFSDIDIIISLSKNFRAVILYEPLVYRRLHDTNYISSNWRKSYHEGAEIITRYKEDLSAQIFNDALFRLYINFGEDCLLRKEKKLAILCFLKAWKHKPLSLYPVKKMAKTLMSRNSVSQFS